MEIKLEAISIKKNRIEYEYTCTPDLVHIFNSNTPFFIEYQTDINLESVPCSVLAVPFVVNLLPICWIYDVTLKVDELDEDCFRSIADMKAGYASIFTDVPMGGEVQADKLVQNCYTPSDRATCLFSGGVDATYTFLRHREEHPVIVNVWGVDTNFEDSQGHKEMEHYFHEFAEKFDTSYFCIKSTLRKFLNEDFLNRDGYKRIGDYWWHGAQHSIGLLSLMAPYDYIYKVHTNYIASSFTPQTLRDGVRSVTYPVVDNALKMCSAVMNHDGYGDDRSIKLAYIMQVSDELNQSVDLKVCFHYVNGKNCCQCEKCYRTITAMLIINPQVDICKFGFNLPKGNRSNVIRNFLDTHEVPLYNWEKIQSRYRENPINRDLKWLAN